MTLKTPWHLMGYRPALLLQQKYSPPPLKSVTLPVLNFFRPLVLKPFTPPPTGNKKHGNKKHGKLMHKPLIQHNS